MVLRKQSLEKPQSNRSNHQRCSIIKGVLRNFAKFTGKHLRQSLFFNKVATLLKKRFWHRCFPMNFAKFLRTPFLQNTSGQQLLVKVQQNLGFERCTKFCLNREEHFNKIANLKD